MTTGEEAATTTAAAAAVKKPSKKDLKKAAKKAEKAAAKDHQKTTAKNDKDDTAAAAVAAPVPVCYSVVSDGKDDAPALTKIAATAALYGVDLERSVDEKAVPSVVRGPALLLNGTMAAFGANTVCKALAVSDVLEDIDLTLVDEYLELERSHLRHPQKSKQAVAAVEKAIVDNHAGGGFFLVGRSLTIADISILVTLQSLVSSKAPPTLPPTVQTYYDHHIRSSLFTNAASSPILQAPQPFDYRTDPSMNRAVQSVFLTAIKAAFPRADISRLPPLSKLVTTPNNVKHGDYQCNVAMPLFAAIKGTDADIRSPQDVAKAVVANVSDDNPVLHDFTINGPGFIMCRVSATYLVSHVNALVQPLSSSPQGPLHVAPETVVVDFSSPNIAKEMHVGHLRSTILGESVCRILEFCGHRVNRVNHVGDWGTQFGMLIQFLKEMDNDDEGGSSSTSEEKAAASISDLTVFYKKAKERFDESPEFKKISQTNVVLLQSGDPECLRIWKVLCDVSRKEFQKVYARLSVEVQECGESFYNDKIPTVIKEFEAAGLIDVQEGGAKCVFVPKFKIPLMLQKSDGGYGYDSTDMAALKHRLQTLKATRIIVITDFSQGDHFKMCNSAAAKIGWVGGDKNRARLEHIGFGTVMGEDGKRFKTRSGDTVRLVDLLDEAVKRMEDSLYERITAGKVCISKEEVPKVAAILGYGAVKYFDLRRNPTTNYKFSYDAMLDTKGNTAIYLLYTHARLESIIAKAKRECNCDVEVLMEAGNKASIVLGHPNEIKLAYNLQMFADTVEITLEDLYPYHICEFLFNTTIAASEFVTQCRVLNSDEMESRLLLCRATTIVMRQCFDLLGIGHVMRI